MLSQLGGGCYVGVPGGRGAGGKLKMEIGRDRASLGGVLAITAITGLTPRRVGLILLAEAPPRCFDGSAAVSTTS
jgi:hypothetical protein